MTKLWFFGSVKVLDALQQACLILFKRHTNSIGSQLCQIVLTEKCFHPFNNATFLKLQNISVGLKSVLIAVGLRFRTDLETEQLVKMSCKLPSISQIGSRAAVKIAESGKNGWNYNIS